MKYADAGVDISAAEQIKLRIRTLAGRTATRDVLGGIGAFGALYALDRKRWKEPVLVASADGVGTKLAVAQMCGVHSTVGADLVHHCVNDILVQGAEPLFFLDYLAMGRLEPRTVEQIVEGLSRACKQVGCALVGGETAEMPGFYAPGEYDLAGFIVGAVERSRLLTGERIRPGDVLIGLPSSGLHTNGYSLARKLIFEVQRLTPESYVAEVGNKIGAELLKPHRCYLAAVKPLLAKDLLAGMAHITGGGITGNLPRVLPRNTRAVVELGTWPVPRIFAWLQRIGRIEPEEMLRTFNCGIGMILVVPAKHLSAVEAELKRRREKFFRIGRIEPARSGAKPDVSYTGTLA
ncbi:MAG: phosphoribosylformylglycinamidine cyclo-ligase [Acidobacteriia bacterium]|jgi:phosphoribosylformylglycinamidine cyclo-ligase|nr:phosphoribosylformylglycinamidine cyclo-ligase [Terriglobia bacterium]